MVDYAAISAAAIVVLTPYAKKAGNEFLETIGETALVKARQLFDWIRDQFSGDAVAEKDFERFSSDPDRYGPGLEDSILERAKSDDSFASTLQQQLDEITTEIRVHQKVKFGKEIIGVEGDVLKATVSVIQEVGYGDRIVGVKGNLGG